MKIYNGAKNINLIKSTFFHRKHSLGFERTYKDKYRSFQELSKNERKDIDYEIILRDRKSNATIVAIHGGKIEPCTTELAEAISGDDFNFYTFKGIKNNWNYSSLHITSHRFNEPKCVDLIKKSELVVAIHGCSDSGEQIFIGGLDKSLKDKISSELESAGYNVQCNNHSYPGRAQLNICNRGVNEAGIQLELTWALRRDIDVYNFSRAIRRAILSELSD